MRALRLLAVALLALSIPQASAQVVRQVTDLVATTVSEAAVSDTGDAVFAVSTADPYGSNPDHLPQVFVWEPLPGGGAQVTTLPGGVDTGDFGFAPSVTDDGSAVVVLVAGRLTLVHVDAGDSLELTPQLTGPGHFQIAGNGNRIVFEATDDLRRRRAHRLRRQ